MLESLNASYRQRLVVYGDSLATNLYQGLRSLDGCRTEAFIISRRARRGSGLVRNDQFDWLHHIRRFAVMDRPDVIVASLGGNDRQAILPNGRRLQSFTSQWRLEYDRRLCRFMRHLTTTRSRVFWLGLPIVRSPRMSADLVKLNKLIRCRAANHSIAHINIWDGFTDAQGRYTDCNFSPDDWCHRQRHIDGIHFASAGRKRLAELVLAAIRGATEERSARRSFGGAQVCHELIT